jgi:hypothetical protein
MSFWRRLFAWDHVPAVRHGLLLVGVLLIILSPLIGAIPGPGGVFVFAAGFGLVLKYSGWAKRQYVRFKRSHPKKGGWVDWGLRRASHRRREAIRKEREAGEQVEAAAVAAPASD